jgi:hypothetical protein
VNQQLMNPDPKSDKVPPYDVKIGNTSMTSHPWYIQFNGREIRFHDGVGEYEMDDGWIFVVENHSHSQLGHSFKFTGKKPRRGW